MLLERGGTFKEGPGGTCYVLEDMPLKGTGELWPLLCFLLIPGHKASDFVLPHAPTMKYYCLSTDIIHQTGAIKIGAKLKLITR
jgi:hypothetical protein